MDIAQPRTGLSYGCAPGLGYSQYSFYIQGAERGPDTNLVDAITTRCKNGCFKCGGPHKKAQCPKLKERYEGVRCELTGNWNHGTQTDLSVHPDAGCPALKKLAAEEPPKKRKRVEDWEDEPAPAKNWGATQYWPAEWWGNGHHGSYGHYGKGHGGGYGKGKGKGKGAGKGW